MANELQIKITTKYDQAEKGFNKVTGSIKKYGDELLKASKEGKVLDDQVKDYVSALNKALVTEDKTKDGMAALTAQSKLLGKEIAKLGLAFGDDDKTVKALKQALAQVKSEMDAIPASIRKTSSGMKEMDKTSGNAATKLLSVAKNILKFQLLMGPITGAIRGFKNTLSDSVKMAAEAEQTFSKLSTVFAGLEESARGAASAISGQLGVATSTAAGALSTVGDLLQAQGMGTAESLSTASSWVSQFQDIIAFKDINMSLEEFAQNFMSGAAGNLRNFRTFGSIVKESAVNARLASQGLDKLTGSELELAKMTARAEIALEQQANAMGATKREWETMLSVNRRLTEAWKEYKENLGESINSILKPAKGWLTEILDYTNDVAKILKEIDGGEFTVKVQPQDSNKLFAEMEKVVLSMPATRSAETKKSGWEGFLNQVLIGQTAQAGGALGKVTLDVNDSLYGGLTTDQVVAMMKSMGVSIEQVQAYAETYGRELSDSVIEEASSIVNAWKAQEEAISKVRSAMLTSAENFDNFTESLATLAHISVSSTDITALATSANITNNNKDKILGNLNKKGTNESSAVISEVLRQFGGFDTSTFTSVFDQAFGTGNPLDAYKAWMAEIESLYTILYNREQKFGDVGQQTLDDVIDEWGRVNRLLDEYNAGLEKAKNEQMALASAQSTAADYRSQLDNFGLSQYQITRNSLQGKINNAQTGAEANLYSDALRDFNSLTAKQLIASFSGVSSAAKMATLRMSENQKALYELSKRYIEASKSEALDENDRKALAEAYLEERQALIDLQEAQEKLRKEEEEAAKAAARLQAWQATGNRALGATGTVGGIIQAFQGEGDIWSKIINAILTILENTESWPKIAEMLNQIFDMFEPLVEQMLDLLVSASPAFEIIIFCLKVIASAISFVQMIINQIQTIVKGIWENIKTFFSNFGKIMTGRYKGGWFDMQAELNKVTEDGIETLKKIWQSTSTIEKKMDNKDLKLLEDLWNRGVITTSQYYKETGAIQGTYVPSPVRAEYPIGSNAEPGYNSVSYGGVTIVVNGNDPAEIERVLMRFFQRQGIAYNEPLGV